VVRSHPHHFVQPGPASLPGQAAQLPKAGLPLSGGRICCVAFSIPPLFYRSLNKYGENGQKSLFKFNFFCPAP
jgi:hypothetical protein